MPFATLRRDIAIRSLPIWGAVTLGVMGTLLGLRAYLEMEIPTGPNSGSGQFWSTVRFLATLWIPVSIFLVYTGIATRYSRLDLTLPVSTRRLWVSHMTALVISATVILGLCAALLSLQTRGFRGWLRDDKFLSEPSVTGLLPLLISVLILSCVVLQSRHPSLRKDPLDWSYALFVGLTLAGTFGLVVLLTFLPPVSVLIPLVLAATIGLRTFRSLPAAYKYVSSKVVDPGHSDSKVVDAQDLAVTDTPRRWAALLMRTLWSTILGWKVLLFFPFVILFGGLFSGLTSWAAGYSDERFANTAICWYMLLAILPAIMKKLHTLDALPISRKLLFACVIGPGLLSVVTGYGIAELIKAVPNKPVEHIRMMEIDDHFYLTVPAENCDITWNQPPPENTSPWGEAHDAWRAGLHKDRRVGIYSPYSTPPGSSIDFVAWQISRAVNNVYSNAVSSDDAGVPNTSWDSPGESSASSTRRSATGKTDAAHTPLLTLDEIKTRYLEIDAAGRVAPKGGALTILADHPELKTRGRGRIFPSVMVIAFVPFFLLLWVYLAAFAPGSSRSRQTWTAIVLLVGAITLHLGGFAGAILKFYALWVHTAFIKIVIRYIDTAIPGGTPALWMVCGLLLVLGYWLAQRRFEQIEIPAAPRKPVD